MVHDCMLYSFKKGFIYFIFIQLLLEIIERPPQKKNLLWDIYINGLWPKIGTKDVDHCT